MKTGAGIHPPPPLLSSRMRGPIPSSFPRRTYPHEDGGGNPSPTPSLVLADAGTHPLVIPAQSLPP